MSVKSDLASALKTVIAGLGFSGISSSNIYIRKKAYNRPKVTLGIVIVPQGMVPAYYSNERDKNGYRFKIVAFKTGNEDTDTNVATVPDMIETIQKTFHGKAVSGVTESVFSEAGASTDFADGEFKAGYEACYFVLTCNALEVT